MTPLTPLRDSAPPSALGGVLGELRPLTELRAPSELRAPTGLRQLRLAPVRGLGPPVSRLRSAGEGAAALCALAALRTMKLRFS